MVAFISEIHYRNAAVKTSGVAEYVEISVLPDDRSLLSDHTLTTYQSDGTRPTPSPTGTVDPATGCKIFQHTTTVTDPDRTSGVTVA